jgi:hypothetical protein
VISTGFAALRNKSLQSSYGAQLQWQKLENAKDKNSNIGKKYKRLKDNEDT